ncbi:MAG: hypothetical protein ACYTDX_09120 [Planctomycetota bacterium]|jgi:hypothetical protein
MKKNTTHKNLRKLSVKRETLVHLNDQNLNQANGAAVPPTYYFCGTTMEGDCW